VGEERRGAERMVGASAPGGEDRNLGRSGIECGEERELGVGCVLIYWMPFNNSARSGERGDLLRAQRIKVTNHSMQRYAESSGVVRSRVGANDEVGVTPTGSRGVERCAAWRVTTREDQSAHAATFLSQGALRLPSPA
jgi:hypothetical protein